MRERGYSPPPAGCVERPAPASFGPCRICDRLSYLRRGVCDDCRNPRAFGTVRRAPEPRRAIIGGQR